MILGRRGYRAGRATSLFRRPDRNVEASKKVSDWAGWERDDDQPDMRGLGGHLFDCVGMCRDLCCLSLWLQRRPNSIGRADGSKRDDRSASDQTIRLPRYGHLKLNRSKRHGPDK
jgi:hypothetical protein